MLSWPLIEAHTVWKRAGRAVDIGVELAIDSGQYSVEASRGGYWCSAGKAVLGGRSAGNGQRQGSPVYQQSRGLR